MPGFTHHPDGRPFNPADYPDIYAVDGDGRVVPEAWIEEARAASANDRVARTLAPLNHRLPTTTSAPATVPGLSLVGNRPP